MKILFLAKHKWPHVGGVEQHIRAVSEQLIMSNPLRGKNVQVKTVSTEDIKYPNVKFIGLIYIWFWLFKNRKLVIDADIVHCHDVFVWYLPFRFLYSNKPVFTTFHGWEGIYPVPIKNILMKRLASKLSWKTIAIGRYIEKYYGIKADKIMYGGVEKSTSLRQGFGRRRNTIVWLGRQDKDTGINEFKIWLKLQKIKYKVKYTTNDPNPKKYLKTAEYCVPAGYLSYIEAKSYGCKIMTFANNPLKEHYWNEIKRVKKFPSWDKIADEYINLYHSSK